MNFLFDVFGGRKYFYMMVFLLIATWLCRDGKITGTEWAALAGLMFNGIVIANSIEANGKLKYAPKQTEATE